MNREGYYRPLLWMRGNSSSGCALIIEGACAPRDLHGEVSEFGNGVRFNQEVAVLSLDRAEIQTDQQRRECLECWGVMSPFVARGVCRGCVACRTLFAAKPDGLLPPDPPSAHISTRSATFSPSRVIHVSTPPNCTKQRAYLASKGVRFTTEVAFETLMPGLLSVSRALLSSGSYELHAASALIVTAFAGAGVQLRIARVPWTRFLRLCSQSQAATSSSSAATESAPRLRPFLYLVDGGVASLEYDCTPFRRDQNQSPRQRRRTDQLSALVQPRSNDASDTPSNSAHVGYCLCGTSTPYATLPWSQVVMKGTEVPVIVHMHRWRPSGAYFAEEESQYALGALRALLPRANKLQTSSCSLQESWSRGPVFPQTTGTGDQGERPGGEQNGEDETTELQTPCATPATDLEPPTPVAFTPITLEMHQATKRASDSLLETLNGGAMQTVKRVRCIELSDEVVAQWPCGEL